MTHAKPSAVVVPRYVQWEGDALERKKYADFLTNYVEGKCARDKPAFVVALDAPWGAGKTFFVEHWAADLTAAKRPVVVFNAWENDSADDPTIAFMAELRKGLSPLRDEIPLDAATLKAVEKTSLEVIGHLRRALMPVMGVAAKAILKKASGIAVEEVMDAMAGADDSAIDASDFQDLSTDALDKSLDVFFEKALEGHSERLNSIRLFRASLEEFLLLLSEKAGLCGPLYVFIDELDRCRPDYAIRLLEGVKHLFSVKGVVFVVSTNLSQLSKAVGAVYGLNFDGYMYLKRFFDVEFTLPEPTRRAYIELRIRGTVLDEVKGCAGLDPAIQPNEKQEAVAVMAYLADALQLDLRSVQSIISVAEAVVLGLPAGTRVAIMWLFFVATARHCYPEIFKLISSSNSSPSEFVDSCRRVLTGPSMVPSLDRREGRHVRFPLAELLGFFYNASRDTNSNLVHRLNRLDDQWGVQFPDVLLHELIQFTGSGVGGLHPISAYPELVTLAGHISQ